MSIRLYKYFENDSPEDIDLYRYILKTGKYHVQGVEKWNTKRDDLSLSVFSISRRFVKSELNGDEVLDGTYNVDVDYYDKTIDKMTSDEVKLFEFYLNFRYYISRLESYKNKKLKKISRDFLSCNYSSNMLYTLKFKTFKITRNKIHIFPVNFHQSYNYNLNSFHYMFCKCISFLYDLKHKDVKNMIKKLISDKEYEIRECEIEEYNVYTKLELLNCLLKEDVKEWSDMYTIYQDGCELYYTYGKTNFLDSYFDSVGFQKFYSEEKMGVYYDEAIRRYDLFPVLIKKDLTMMTTGDMSYLKFKYMEILDCFFISLKDSYFPGEVYIVGNEMTSEEKEGGILVQAI